MPTSQGEPSVLIFGIILPWIVVALGCWLIYQLVRQQGRILLRLEALEQQLGQLQFAIPSQGPSLPIAPKPTPSLPAGTLAPDFELPDLSGQTKGLSEFRGQKVLLTFFNPGCGFCVQMAPDLAALPSDGAEGLPVPLVVTTGDREANRRGGVCTDTSVDPLNCGGCGHSCNGGTCVNGTCVSSCAGTVCNGVCTDTSVDPNNCGTCGNRCFITCPGGVEVPTFCVEGACTQQVPGGGGGVGCPLDNP